MAVLVVAGLLVYHKLTSKLAPIGSLQLENSSAPLTGTWVGDGVELDLEDPGGIGNIGSFDYSYTGNLLYRMPSWTAPFGHQSRSGDWIVTDVPGSRDAAIKLWLAAPADGGLPGEHTPSIVLALVGNPANPTIVCQHPAKGDPCTLTKEG
jgi:hypothetical protein